ncbi:MAG: hypothetical protein HYS44_03425 [Candidatus Niyogibacteria bacterium]|nr:hypothetical protein [Candidatus Niyogibacteria bacterium]
MKKLNVLLWERYRALNELPQLAIAVATGGIVNALMNSHSKILVIGALCFVLLFLISNMHFRYSTEGKVRA